MGRGLLPAQEIAELILKRRIEFSESVFIGSDNPFLKLITQSAAEELPMPWGLMAPLTLSIPGGDKVYHVGDYRPPSPGESLEEYIGDVTDGRVRKTGGKFPLASNSTYLIVADPVFHMEELTGIISNPSSLARSTILVNGLAPSKNTRIGKGYNYVPAGFSGKVLLQARTHEHGFVYEPNTPLASIRFSTEPYQSMYTLNRAALQALAHSLWDYGEKMYGKGIGLLNTPEGEGIFFDDLQVDESGKIPISGYLEKDAEIFRATNSSRNYLEMHKKQNHLNL